jgi:archaellum component FlaC
MSNNSPIPNQTIQSIRDALQSLEDNLDGLTPTNEAQSQAISCALDAVTNLLTLFNQEDMLSRDGAINEVVNEMRGPLEALTELKNQLNQISGTIANVTILVNAVDQVVNGCNTLFV